MYLTIRPNVNRMKERIVAFNDILDATEKVKGITVIRDEKEGSTGVIITGHFRTSSLAI